MDLLELAISLVEKGGAAAGLGGGFIATRVLGKISEGLKDAKAARDDAAAAKKQASETHTKLEAIAAELQAVRSDFDRMKRASFSSEVAAAHDSRFGERIATLEARVSGVEDELDDQAKENKRSWEAIQRSVGRIEGSLRPNR